MAKNDRYFGKTIAEHVDAGTCWLCGQPVDRGQGYHDATGAHWVCSKALTNQFKALSHPVTGASLCGHKPKDKARRVRPRARWIPINRVPRGFKRCPHCARTSSSTSRPVDSPQASSSNVTSPSSADRDTRTRDLFEEHPSQAKY